MEHAGIDVDKNEGQVCILAVDGSVVLEKRIRTHRQRFAEELKGAAKQPYPHRGVHRE